jgi:hypothetical protein
VPEIEPDKFRREAKNRRQNIARQDSAGTGRLAEGQQDQSLVPGLTSNAGIQLNARVSLLIYTKTIAWLASDGLRAKSDIASRLKAITTSAENTQPPC